MHAAPSVILFTVLSGAGFGALFFLGLGMPDLRGLAAFVAYALAFGLAVGGLVSSAFHLGNPQRALLAFTQWSTSWLSREAVLSVAALVTMGLTAIGAIFWDTRWALPGSMGAALSLLSVYATGMIYAQMRTIPRWNTPLTPVYYLTSALAGGAILTGNAGIGALLSLALGVVQVACWMGGDGRFAARGHTIATATGIGSPGTLRLFEPPHTGSNYLLNEFVHQVGRRRARSLRVIALFSISILPALILLAFPASLVALVAAFALHMSGALASRWLFFAEAEHVVGLYYGVGPQGARI